MRMQRSTDNRQWLARIWSAFTLMVIAVISLQCAVREQDVGDAPLAVTWYFSFGYEMTPPYFPKPGHAMAGWEVRVARPDIGFYASGDEETIRWQLDQMMSVGVSVVFLSWWGWGDHNLDGDVEGDIGQAYNESISTALRYIQKNDLPFEFAILVEDSWGAYGDLETRDLTNDQKDMITDYLWKTYYEPFEDIAFRYFGDKPLLTSAIGEPGPLWGNFDDPRFDLREIYWTLQAEQDGMWTPPTYREPPSVLPGPEGVVMLWPRKSELFLHEVFGEPEDPKVVDPLLKEKAYDKAWRSILEHERRAAIKLLWIWSWNSYNDLLYIESDDGQGMWAHGNVLLRKTQHYYDIYRSGSKFVQYQSQQ